MQLVNISQPFIQELLARTDVIEVVGRHVQLKKAGANFMGLCPFHGEKTPSFTVSPAKQFYHCFGCGASGDAIKFLTEHTGASFTEAVQDLAQRVGLVVPEAHTTPAEQARERSQRDERQSLIDLLAQASHAYQKQLKTSVRAVSYLKERGVSGEIAKTFALGFAPDNWRPLARLLPDYADARLVTVGLVIASDAETLVKNNTNTDADANTDANANPVREGKRYDRFRDRIMFPIRNVKGEVIGFGGRVLDKGEPKYLNSPETPLFSKGRELYGLFEARHAIRYAGYVLVTEGYMDVVALAQLGFAHCVATLGTACTVEHVQKLFRFTDSVVFAFDGDAAGRRAAVKALYAAVPYAQDTRSIKFLFLPDEHDPDSYIRTHGSEAFAQAVGQAVPLSRFLQDTARQHCDMNTPEGQSRFASQVRPLWDALPDGVFKRQLRIELARTVGLGVHELNEVWTQARSRTNTNTHIRPAASGHPPMPADAASDTTVPHGGQPLLDSPNTLPSTPVPRWRPKNNRRSHVNAHAHDLTSYANPSHRRASLPPPSTLSREVLVARLLLTYPVAWQWLGEDDHRLLAALPDEPLGCLLRWLEAQWHEHGMQTEAALRQAMQNQPFAAQAEALWAQSHLLEQSSADSAETLSVVDEQAVRGELQGLLRRMLLVDLEQRRQRALTAMSSDPTALATFKQLYEQWRLLKQEIERDTI